VLDVPGLVDITPEMYLKVVIFLCCKLDLFMAAWRKASSVLYPVAINRVVLQLSNADRLLHAAPTYAQAAKSKRLSMN
jgi:hypothetical protein